MPQHCIPGLYVNVLMTRNSADVWRQVKLLTNSVHGLMLSEPAGKKRIQMRVGLGWAPDSGTALLKKPAFGGNMNDCVCLGLVSSELSPDLLDAVRQVSVSLIL